MLEVTIPDVSLWDEMHEEFIDIKGQTLMLEHSLISLSKWESKWCKPFLTNNEQTNEEFIDYVRCMTLNKNVDPNLYWFIPDNVIQQI